jgi:SPP1 family predicted phage head-tail adaptor
MRRGIRSGELDIRITIQSVTETNDAVTNQEVSTYATLASNVPAKRLGPKSNESFEANQQVAVSVSRYMIRNRSGLTEKMRVVDGGVTYNISGIENFGRQGYTILTVERRDNE